MAVIQGTGGLQSLQRAIWAFRRLTIFRSIVDKPGFADMKAVLELVSTPGLPTGRQGGPDIYHSLVHTLAEVAGTFANPFHADPWKEMVMDAVLYTDTLFGRTAARMGAKDMPPDLLAAVRHDLGLLSDLYYLDPRWIQGAVVQVAPAMPRVSGMLPLWSALMTPCDDEAARADPAWPLKQTLADSGNWADLAEDVAAWHRVHGAGPEARGAALRWEGGLVPVLNPDPVKLSELEGYARQKSVLVDNARRFVAGLPALNVLLHGEKGTGKSSTVKALLWEFVAEGLRLVELDREHLGQLPDVFRSLGTKGGKYLVFIDDLSFEESETSYKGLKSALEGSMEAKPQNVLVYATSNRRHIVREGFSDREESPEVHGGDGLQEKLSLADRFGLSVLFQSPDQAAYIDMVLSMALKAGVRLTESELRRRALKWAMAGNGRSPRAARQFVDSCIEVPR